MIDFYDRHAYKLHFIAITLLMVLALFLLPFFIASAWGSPTVQAAGKDSDASIVSSSLADSPNAVTRGMYEAASKIGQSASTIGEATSSGFQSVAQTVSSTATGSGKFIAGTVGSGASFVSQGTTRGVSFVAHTTGSVFSFITNQSILGDIIRPADNSQVPIIEDGAAIGLEDLNPDAPTKSVPVSDSEAAWPISGEITTEFGVPEPPYQAVHTGIDISDGERPGVTAVHPFKSGVVIQTIRSNLGLGNHIVIDHGGGITSVYGHLASISVAVGQKVDRNTLLGYEGSTGASTGTHVHFEIRLNGQPVNPHQYISGQP
jgi:hypothetical protein